jgi:hypothetical protein
MALPGVEQEQYLTNCIFDGYKGDTSDLGDFAVISRIAATCAQNPDMKGPPVLMAARRISQGENTTVFGLIESQANIPVVIAELIRSVKQLHRVEGSIGIVALLIEHLSIYDYRV